MKQEIIDKLSHDILIEVARYFECRSDDFVQLDGFENFLYETERYGKQFILRITHESHRNENQLNGELEWINYLADNGVATPRAIPSANGRMIETVDTGDACFYVSCFEKVPGKHLYGFELTDDLLVRWGRLTGRMHRLVGNYQPSNPDSARYSWDEEDDVIKAEKYLPANQTKVLYKFEELIKSLRQLPQDKKSYGLIHGDLNPSNILVDNDILYVIDFDDCRYEWFISEIASILFYPIIDEPIEERKQNLAVNFLKHFMSGYSEENQIDRLWFGQFHQFLKLREIGQYISIYRNCDMDNLNNWCRMFMQGRKEMIENDVPVVNLDFALIKC